MFCTKDEKDDEDDEQPPAKQRMTKLNRNKEFFLTTQCDFPCNKIICMEQTNNSCFYLKRMYVVYGFLVNCRKIIQKYKIIIVNQL